MYRVTFNFEQEELGQIKLEQVEAGQTLLELALKNAIAIHHNCGGVCACATCHLYINKGEAYLEEKSRREEHFIPRAIRPKTNSRLACQCLILEGSGEIEVTVPIRKAK